MAVSICELALGAAVGPNLTAPGERNLPEILAKIAVINTLSDWLGRRRSLAGRNSPIMRERATERSGKMEAIVELSFRQAFE